MASKRISSGTLCEGEDYMIYIFNGSWVDTRWQWNSTHLHTNNTQNTENETYITIKKLINLINCKEPVRTAQETRSFSDTKKQSVNVVQNNNDCSGDHAKHMNELCGQNPGFLNVKLVVHIITTRLQTAKDYNKTCLELVMLICIFITT
jgi:hypothetical protein